MALKVASQGDSGEVAEELFGDSISDTWQRSRIVEMAVADGDFSLAEALAIYRVSVDEYAVYVQS